MPVAARLEEKIEIPEDVTVSMDGDKIIASGPNGKNVKILTKSKIDIEIGDDEVTLSVDSPTKREKGLLGSYTSHIQNIIKGAQENFEYKLKILYSHFPVKVRAEGNRLVIENFVGEEEPREAELLGDTEAQVEGDEITLKGPNKEDVAQTAANIEATTEIKDLDKRVFQDGIYIVEKAGKPIV